MTASQDARAKRKANRIAGIKWTHEQNRLASIKEKQAADKRKADEIKQQEHDRKASVILSAAAKAPIFKGRRSESQFTIGALLK